MAITIGRQNVIGIGRQSTKGTGVAPAYYMRKLEFTENRQAEHVNDTSALGVSADSSGAYLVKRWAEPSVGVNLDLTSFGLLEYANSDSYAATDNADTDASVKDHTFKVGTATSISDKYLTLAAEDPTEGDNQYVDAILNNSTIVMNMTEIMRADLEFVSQYPAAQARTLAVTTPQYFLGRMITVEFAATVSALTGTGIKCKNVEIARTNNINNDESAFTLGSVDIDDAHITERMCEITLSQFLDGTTYLDYAKNATHRALRITVTDTGTTIGAAANPSVTFTFPKVSFQVEPEGDNASIRGEKLTIKAHYGEDDDESASYLYKTVIVNTVADYSTV